MDIHISQLIRQRYSVVEIEADGIYLAKAIDGSDSDPKNPSAKKYDQVSIQGSHW